MTEKSEELRMIEHLKRIMDNLGKYWQSIELLLGYVQKPLLIDDKGLRSVLSQLTEKLQIIVKSIENLNLTQTFGEIKYIGKRLNEIESTIKEIKENGIKKKIHLDLTCDGYEMVKKKIKNVTEDDYEEENQVDSEQNVLKLLNTLNERESKVVIHRLGLVGEKQKTLSAIGEIFGVTGERIRLIYAKGLRKLRHPSRKNLVEKITHKELLNEIRGE